MKRFIPLLLILVLIGPFLVGGIANDIRLYNFAAQADDIPKELHGFAEVVGLDRSYYLSGNGEMCTYRFVLVFHLFGSSMSDGEFRQQLKALKLNSARGPADGNSPKITVSGGGHIWTVIVNDGPYDDLLDWRCL